MSGWVRLGPAGSDLVRLGPAGSGWVRLGPAGHGSRRDLRESGWASGVQGRVRPGVPESGLSPVGSGWVGQSPAGYVSDALSPAGPFTRA